MSMTRTLSLPLVCVLAMCGCDSGQGADATGSASASTLPPNALVGELEADDLVYFCERGLELIAVIDEINSDPDLLCIGEGLYARFDGDGQVSTCEAARDSCIEALPEPTGSPEEALDCDPEDITEQGLAACEVTVEVFETCKVAFDELLIEVQESVRCDMSPEKALEMYAIQQQGYPYPCQPVVDGCPLLIDTESLTMPEAPETETDPGH